MIFFQIQVYILKSKNVLMTVKNKLKFKSNLYIKKITIINYNISYVSVLILWITSVKVFKHVFYKNILQYYKLHIKFISS